MREPKRGRGMKTRTKGVHRNRGKTAIATKAMERGGNEDHGGVYTHEGRGQLGDNHLCRLRRGPYYKRTAGMVGKRYR